MAGALRKRREKQGVDTMQMRTIGMGMAVLMLLGFGAGAQTMIYDVNDLQDMNLARAGDYVLANDIDASITSTWNAGAGFVPVGDNSVRFSGTFDGAGYTITGLYINRPSTNEVGLFGSMFGATIQNVRLVDVDITGDRCSAGLVGIAGGGSIFTKCSSTGTVTGASESGGLGGQMENCYVTECWSAANVSGGWFLGGLGGVVEGTALTNCYSSGAVSGSLYVGGLAGFVEALAPVSITNCYSVGAVSGSSDVGGLVGRIFEDMFGVTLTSTYWDIVTSGQATSAGQGPGESEGKTTAEMKQQATFVGWDFTTVWDIRETQTYPFLQAFPAPFVGVIVEQAIDQNDPTDALPIRFDVVFDEPVIGFDSDDVTLAGTASGVEISLQGSGALYTIVVWDVATGGTIEVSIPAEVCQVISDDGPNNASTSFDNTVTYNAEGPPQVPIAWGSVAIALLAAGVVAMRRRRWAC